MTRERKRELSAKTYEEIGRAALRLWQQLQAGKNVDRKALLRSVPADEREEASKALGIGDLLFSVAGSSSVKRSRKR